MTRHLMKSPDDLDEFEGIQASITRDLDREKGANIKLVKKHIEALSLVQAVIRSVPLEMWQRAAYEAHRIACLCGKVPERLVAQSLWRLVEYYQVVLQSADVAIHDPEIRACVKSIGQKLGIDILGDIDREIDK